MLTTLRIVRYFAVLTLLAVTGSFATAQETRALPLQNFDKLDMGSAFVINVRQGNAFSVKATGRADDLDALETNVSGSTLRIGFKSKFFGNSNHQRVTFEIVMPVLKGANFGGASKSTISGFRKQSNVELDISGASTLTADLDADRLKLDVSGASTLTLRGRANQVNLDLSGASSIRATELQVDKAKVEASGASRAQFGRVAALDSQTSGASSVSRQ